MRRFTLRTEHVTLLRAMYVRWDDCEFGAPAIDPKRPYGNSSVLHDMAEILGVEFEYDDDGDRALTSEQEDALRALHRETEQALEIGLATGSFEPGVYVADDYHNNWRRG